MAVLTSYFLEVPLIFQFYQFNVQYNFYKISEYIDICCIDKLCIHFHFWCVNMVNSSLSWFRTRQIYRANQLIKIFLPDWLLTRCQFLSCYGQACHAHYRSKMVVSIRLIKYTHLQVNIGKYCWFSIITRSSGNDWYIMSDFNANIVINVMLNDRFSDYRWHLLYIVST